MKILVTGAAGFIGSNLSKYLLEKDYEVVGIDNFNEYYSPKIKEFNVNSIKDNTKFHLYRISLLERDKLGNVFDENTDISAVVHLAAWAGVTYSVKKPDIYVRNNVVGTNNLTDLCVEKGVNNFIFASTSSIYGDNQTPFKEDMDTSYPKAPYPATKKASEVLLYTISENKDLQVTVFRFFNPLGPNLRPDMALPKLIKSAEYGKVFELWQDPASSARDYTYINDMLEAIEYIINNPFKYEIMNLGNSSPVSLESMIATVEKVTGKKIKTQKNYLPGQMKETYSDITKARELIKYNPNTSLEEMVRIYYEWFLEQPEWYRKDDY